MPGMRCTVAVCRNSAAKCDKTVSFYRFPRNEELRQIWVQKCKRGGKWNPETCRVCSEHFKDDDYQRNLQAELLNYTAKKKLKDTAVPSLNLTLQLDFPETTEKRKRLLKRKNKKALVKHISQRQEKNESESDTQESEDSDPEISKPLRRRKKQK